MKIISIFLLLFHGLVILNAQSKGDFTWVLGYPPNDSAGSFGGTIMDFTSGGLTTRFFDSQLFMENSAQICNNTGQTLFYVNGCKVMNATHEVMENGEGLNPGEMYDIWCEVYEIGYTTHQGLLALPWPDREDQYFIFHLGWYRLPDWPRTKYLRDFYYTHVDMTAENGLGAVVEKNHLILQDTNLIDNLTAVQHGNGRDWWIVLPRGQSDLIYTFLLTPEGLQGPFEQHIGEPTTVRGLVAGQIVFSPDGSRFIRVSASPDGVDIFNFDRCQGVFSHPRRLPFPGDPGGNPSGAAVSPNSRYLYISTRNALFQYDLWSTEIAQSKILLDTYDGFLGDYDATSFYQQRLAPDGKIYMSATNGVRYLHIIHHPDSAGLACNFRQHDLKLPTYHGFCLPNFPNFRLYDVPGSPCDTLGIDAPEEDPPLPPCNPAESLRLIPNPVSGGLATVRFTACSGGLLRVFDVAGRQVLNRAVKQGGEQAFDCSGWPAGVFFVSYWPEGGERCRPVSAKLVITR